MNEIVPDQFDLFPGTRYMGSKNKIIDQIWNYLGEYEFESFLDAFAGSNVVGYFMKCQDKEVLTNDFMANSYIVSKAIIENSKTQLSDKDVEFILSNKVNGNKSFISKRFKGLYFKDSDNKFLDKARANISLLKNDYKQAIALASLVRACLKKRPRGVFTFTGDRYDDGRSDIVRTIESHFIKSVELFNNAVFDNGQKSKAFNCEIGKLKKGADLVYLDPPYYNPTSDNDYVRRYHFVEGLVLNWEGLDIQEHTKTKKFKSYSSPFSKRTTAYKAFDDLVNKYQDSIIAISYSSNSMPSKKEIVSIMSKYKKSVNAHEIDHLYSFGNQNHKIGNTANRVKEYLIIGS